MSSHKHCHFLAAPLAALVLLTVAGLHHVLPVSAGMHTPRFDGVAFVAGDDVREARVGSVAVRIQPGGTVRASKNGSLFIDSGHTLLRTDDTVTLDAGFGVTASFADGSMTVVHGDASVTVAAITTPVVLHRDEEFVLLSPGEQYIVREGRHGEKRTLPTQWFSAEKSDASSLAKPETSGSVGSALATGLLGFDEVQALLPSDAQKRRAVLARLALEGARMDPDAGMFLQTEITADAPLGSALGMSLPSMVLTTAKTVPDEVMDAWAEWMLRHAVSDTAAGLDTLIVASKLPDFMEDRGFPKQSRLWKQSLDHATATLLAIAPEDLRSRVQDIRDGVTAGVAKTDTAEQELLRSAAPVTNWSSEELTMLARNMILTHGALLTMNTEIIPDTALQIVRITGIFISENGSDVPYAFSYDVARNVLTRIVRDGRTMPNTVPPEIFFGA